MLSELRLISLGIVSEHKKPSTHTVLVHPAEILSELNGELRSVPTELYSSGVDAGDNEYTIKIEADSSFECQWLQFGEHRMTSPDVRRGEQVLIWQAGDDETYYWSSFGRDSNLRRLETVIWAISNISDPEANIESLNADNAYLIEWSTHHKHFTIRTNKNDGEPFAIIFQINAKDGNVTIADDVGTYAQLDFKNKMIDLTNADKTHVRLDKKDIFGYAPDSMYLKAVNTMKFNCKDFILEAENTVNISTKTYTATADTMLNKAKSFTTQADNITLDSPVVNCTGVVKCAGIVGGGGARSVDDGAGPLLAKGNFTAEFNIPLIANQGITATAVTTGSIHADSWSGYPANWPN